MKIFQAIIRTGLLKSDSHQKKRSILLTNAMALILASALIIVSLYRLLFYQSLPLTWTIPGLLFFLSPILLNRLSFTTLSRLVVCVAPVVFIWFSLISQLRGMEIISPSIYGGFRIYIVAVCFVPYLLFDKDSVSLLIIGALPSLLSILLFESILNMIDLGYANFGLTSPDYSLQPMRTLTSYLIINAACYTFNEIINQNDKFNQKLLSELNTRAEEVKSQNEKLVVSESNLYELNQRLEDLIEQKINDIRRQNEILLKYSFENAHHVRGPVARILGLIQLSKMNVSLDYPWFFDKVKNEVNQIDAIITRISKELDETPRLEE